MLNTAVVVLDRSLAHLGKGNDRCHIAGVAQKGNYQVKKRAADAALFKHSLSQWLKRVLSSLSVAAL